MTWRNPGGRGCRLLRSERRPRRTVLPGLPKLPDGPSKSENELGGGRHPAETRRGGVLPEELGADGPGCGRDSRDPPGRFPARALLVYDAPKTRDFARERVAFEFAPAGEAVGAVDPCG